jgi:hypothetical protein
MAFGSNFDILLLLILKGWGIEDSRELGSSFSEFEVLKLET